MGPFYHKLKTILGDEPRYQPLEHIYSSCDALETKTSHEVLPLCGCVLVQECELLRQSKKKKKKNYWIW